MEDTPEAVRSRAESLVSDHAELMRKLVAHRERHKLSQAIVAERMGVSQPSVAKFERYDSNPTLSTIRRYALAVGVRLHTLVEDDCVHVEVEIAMRQQFSSWTHQIEDHDHSHGYWVAAGQFRSDVLLFEGAHA